MQHAQALLQSATGVNPAVESIANYVTKKVGSDTFTPDHLYELRKVLVNKLSGPSVIGDELSAAAKGAQRETMGLIKAIDDSLEQASKGQWSPYMAEYARRSEPVTSGRAMRDVYEELSKKPYKGSTPEVTYHGLRGIVEREGTSKKFGEKFAPETSEALESLVQHLRQSEAPARTRKIAATMGGGSITNTDQMMAETLASC